jgi:CheY-like chemotaxis protein
MVRIPAATLRTWEERYGVVQPARSAGGHRLYSRRDVERLRFVADRVREGISPGDAHRLLSAVPGTLPPPVAEPDAKIVILLAERDPYAADFAEFFLRTEGFEVVLALDAADALRALTEDRRLQLAVIGLLISGGAGLELCRRVHERGIPVLAVSTMAARDAALEAGASAFLQKPLDPLRLVSAVKDLLGTSSYLKEVVPAR